MTWLEPVHQEKCVGLLGRDKMTQIVKLLVAISGKTTVFPPFFTGISVFFFKIDFHCFGKKTGFPSFRVISVLKI